MKLILKSIVRRSNLVLLILLVSVVVLIFSLVNIQKTYNNNIRALKEKIAVISNAKTMLQEALKKNIREKQNYELSLKDAAERNRVLNDQLAKLFSEAAEKKDQIASINSELGGLKNENTALKNKLNEVWSEKNLFADRIAYLQKIQDNMQKKIKRLLIRSKVELGEVVVNPSMLNGKILKASRKYNFVIIDLGKNDGVQIGAKLTAYRGDKKIGGIKVEKVYDELSVGSAAFEWRGNELDVCDTVKGSM